VTKNFWHWRVQSLADLGKQFFVIQKTRLVPFKVRDLARLAAATQQHHFYRWG